MTFGNVHLFAWHGTFDGASLTISDKQLPTERTKANIRNASASTNAGPYTFAVVVDKALR
ncbi:hypothetical protein BDZ89DRAFT_390847 [Hymenopellis radicata]|nr:hypothetical protein BDZ89DRAFT_390847 [Hymenopellis radicata]